MLFKNNHNEEVELITDNLEVVGFKETYSEICFNFIIDYYRESSTITNQKLVLYKKDNKYYASTRRKFFKEYKEIK